MSAKVITKKAKKSKHKPPSATLAPSARQQRKNRENDLIILETNTDRRNLFKSRLAPSRIKLANGDTITPDQFRDPSCQTSENYTLPAKGSAWFPQGKKYKCGNHEICESSQCNTLSGNKVAVAIGEAARISTAFALLREKPGDDSSPESIVHSGMMVLGSKSTKGQPAAHKIFHDFPAKLIKRTDPYIASYEAIMTALNGLTRGRYIRGDSTLTGSMNVLGFYFEPPDTKRGQDDGYGSDTGRGQYVKRFEIGINQLKNTAHQIVEQRLSKKPNDHYFVEVAKMFAQNYKKESATIKHSLGKNIQAYLKKTSPAVKTSLSQPRRTPSPLRKRGAMKEKGFDSNFKLPNFKPSDKPETIARTLTNFAFQNFQTRQ